MSSKNSVSVWGFDPFNLGLACDFFLYNIWNLLQTKKCPLHNLWTKQKALTMLSKGNGSWIMGSMRVITMIVFLHVAFNFRFKTWNQSIQFLGILHIRLCVFQSDLLTELPLTMHYIYFCMPPGHEWFKLYNSSFRLGDRSISLLFTLIGALNLLFSWWCSWNGQSQRVEDGRVGGRWISFALFEMLAVYLLSLHCSIWHFSIYQVDSKFHAHVALMKTMLL